MKTSKLWHVPKYYVVLPVLVLPFFVAIAYWAVRDHDYVRALVSIVLWFAILLFVINYWFQALATFVGAVVALYYQIWWLGVGLFALSLYLVNAARLVDTGKIGDFSALRVKMPFAGRLLDGLRDRKNARIILLAACVLAIFLGILQLVMRRAR